MSWTFGLWFTYKQYFFNEFLIYFQRGLESRPCREILHTRNTCMQQPLTYIFQTLFQHEVFVITPALNAGSRCSRHVSHGNTIIDYALFLNILTSVQINLQKIDET